MEMIDQDEIRIEVASNGKIYYFDQFAYSAYLELIEHGKISSEQAIKFVLANLAHSFVF